MAVLIFLNFFFVQNIIEIDGIFILSLLSGHQLSLQVRPRRVATGRQEYLLMLCRKTWTSSQTFNLISR